MEKRLPLSVGTVLQGRYRIVRQLGHGGFGAVYEAVDDDINLSFALKETFYASDDDFRQAFKREARMLASLSHDAFPRVSHYFTEGDGCFLVMELVQGEDLDKHLEKRGAPFDEEKVLEWADQILDALEDLHAKGIVHRDIKPSNIKLTPKGKIKLLDFGIAKGTVEGETTFLKTVGSLAAATLQYAPLEQVLKASEQYQMMLSVVSSDKVMEIMKRGTDASSDIYALAATLYHLLTKTLPADAPTRALAIWSGQNDRLVPAHEVNPKVSKAVSGVLQKALNLNRDERFQTAAEMRRMLKEEVAAVEPISAPTEMLQNPTYPTEQVTHLKAQFSNPKPLRQPPPAYQVPLSPAMPKSVHKNNKNSFGFYAAVIGLPVLLAVIVGVGLIAYAIFSKRNITANGTYEMTQTLPTQSDQVNDVIFSPDGKTFASSIVGGGITVWDASSFSIKETLPSASEPSFSPDGKYFAYSNQDAKNKYSLVVRQTATNNALQLVFSDDEPFYSIKFSSDGGFVYYVKGNNRVPKSFEPYQTPTLGGTPKQLLKDTGNITFSPDKSKIAGTRGAVTNELCIWILGTNEFPLRTFTGTRFNATFASFSPDGKTIAAADTLDIKIWEILGKDIPTMILKGHQLQVIAIVYSPDGKLIASGSMDSTIKIWDAVSGNLLQTLTGHNGNINALAFSPDGKTLISGSADKTIKIWRIK